MFCRYGFTADGMMCLTYAHISGELDFDQAHLANATGFAISARKISVDGDMHFRRKSTVTGTIRLLDACIGGRLDFEGSRLSRSKPGDLILDLGGIHAAVLDLRLEEPPECVIDLTYARVGSLIDAHQSWPAVVRLRGFTYEILEDESGRVRDRLRWLARDPDGYAPGIYDQLAAVYRRAGRVEDARRVAVAKHQRLRGQLNPLGRLWNWLLFLTVGYGYRTWWAGLWLAGLVLVGSAEFASAYPVHMHRTSAIVPAFSPIAYTLDVLLPVVDLGQQKAWIAQGGALVWTWFLTGAGWVLTTAVVVGLTSALRRD